MKVKVLIHKEDPGYWAEVPSLPGCFTQGDSMEELIKNLYEAIEGWIETREKMTRNKNRTNRNVKILELIV
jgi:predicted RNase H-like HicB family nuclease